MTGGMTKPKRPPTNREFNAAILDRITAHTMPTDQRDDEFSITDLVARGMKDSTARRFCASEWSRGALDRRIGRVRATGRKGWIFRMKEGAQK